MTPEQELFLIEKLEKERETSNSSYAPMIVKTIVYGFVGMICVAFIGFLTKLIW